MAELSATQPMHHHTRLRLGHLLEVSSAIILALGGVTSAWSGYEAALFEGQQAAAYARGSALRASSTRSATMAGQLADIDVLTFLSWANAYSSGQQEFRVFVEHRFRPEFRPAFEAWLATKPLIDPTAPASFFVMPEYQPRHAADAARLSLEADRAQREGDLANAQGDQYARTTIVFALSLFFIAMAQQFKSLSVRAAVVTTAGTLMVFGLWLLAQLPRAFRG